MATLTNVTDNSFDAQVLKCDIPVLTDFWAEWCQPCQAIEQHLTDLAGEHEEQLKIVRLKIETNPTVTADYNVLNIPTLILFKHGQEVERLTGAQSKQEILEAVTPHLDQ